MLRLMHTQPDPLPITPLRPGRLGYHWAWIQENKYAFDDYTSLEYETFVPFVLGPASRSWEIGDGVGLATLIFSSPANAYIQMAMYDWNYRDEVCRSICNEGFEHGAVRITTTVTEDRDAARILVKRIGAKYEGTMRKAYYRKGKFLDIEVYGFYKEAA